MFITDQLASREKHEEKPPKKSPHLLLLIIKNSIAPTWCLCKTVTSDHHPKLPKSECEDSAWHPLKLEFSLG